MRIGYNPNKDKKLDVFVYSHQVIIPVHIPNLTGYFMDGLRILEYCLESLFKTIHDHTFITVVNNGSCKKVEEYLESLFKKGLLQELIHTANIGKLNAVLKGLVGHNIPIVTISDADVLFLNNWQSKTLEIFNTFPKTGSVCPTPSSKSYNSFTQNILCELFFSKKLRFSKVKNPEALIKFGISIGKKEFYNKFELEKYLTVTENKISAVIGSGHYVASYNRSIFKTLVNTFAESKMGAGSESEFLDKPVLNFGLWRLSTNDNYAYHMGNVLEDWMPDEMLKLKSDIYVPFNFKDTLQPPSKFKKLGFYFFGKLLRTKFIKVKFLNYKGLSKQAASFYS